MKKNTVKAKISGVAVYKTNIHIRIKVNRNTQKRYNQFKQELVDRYGFSYIKGYAGFTKLIGKGIDINVFKRKDYLHFVVYGKLRKKILNIILKYFEYIKNNP